MSRSGRLLCVLALLFTGLLWPVATSQASETSTMLQGQSSVIEYWALGDSIAAGTGLGDDAQGVDATACHRSWDRAYPQRLADELANHFDEVNFPPEHFLACNGARVLADASEAVQNCEDDHPGDPDCKYKWLRNQVTTVVVHLEALRRTGLSRPTLVTITAGANDLNYTNPFTIYQAITWPDWWFNGYIQPRKDGVFWGFLGQLSRLLRYENVTVVVTDIHNPFNQDSFAAHLPGSHCKVVFDGPSPIDCYARTEHALHSLNEAIQGAVDLQFRPHRVGLASIHKLFHGHEAPQAATPSGITPCGYGPPAIEETWIQYSTDPNSNTYPFVSDPLIQLLVPGAGQWSGDCVHPNDEGAQQYANAVREVALDLLD